MQTNLNDQIAMLPSVTVTTMMMTIMLITVTAKTKVALGKWSI